MTVLLVASDRPGAGKTSLVGALLARLTGEGKRVGYYKPFSTSPASDSDVAFISQHLLAGSDGPPVPSPQPIPPPSGPQPLLAGPQAQIIRQTVAKLASEASLVLLESAELPSSSGETWSLSLELATLLECRALLLFRYRNGLTPAEVLGAIQPFSHGLAGVVINGVTRYRGHQADRGLAAELRSSGVPVLGVLPEDRTMLSMTVGQIAGLLGGRWVQEPVNTDTLIERFLIGGNIMDSGTTYFGRFAKQAVVTRSERPDIQLASLMQDTRCLILTGGGEPTEYIKAEALQRDVPLLLVQQGTLSTAEALGGLLERATPYHTEKIARFAKLIQQNLDMAALDSVLN